MTENDEARAAHQAFASDTVETGDGNTENLQRQTVYFVDGEDEPGDPSVFKIELTNVVRRGGMSKETFDGYLEMILESTAEYFNAAVYKTEDEALETAQKWADETAEVNAQHGA